MKVKNFFRNFFLILVVTTLALSVCGCRGFASNKTVKVEIITEEKTNTVTRTTEIVELGEGEHYQLIDIVSIDKDTVSYTWNLDEVTAKYDEIKTFHLNVMDYGTYTYNVKISKE